jgi:hypothetical protein
VIWDLADGHAYVTTPGSAVLFPGLCTPTGHLPTVQLASGARCANREAMMPTRTPTRAQNRANRINAERRHNRQTRLAAQAAHTDAAPTPTDPDEPPPF